MRILLDTTYLLPTIGVAVKELPRNAIASIISKKHAVTISEISIFELAANGAKLVKNGNLEPEAVTRGIRALTYNDQITTVPIHDTGTLHTAFKIRNALNDFIDCLILSTAINNCDLLITEDNDMLKLRNDIQFNELLRITNPTFKMNTLSKTFPNLLSQKPS